MASRFVFAVSCLLAPLAGLLAEREASANGRPPTTSTISFRRGMEREVAVGLTFGLLVSRDGGATWSWMCEDAIGYGGAYDPDYVLTSSGALLGTTFTGIKAMRDGCTFGPTAAGARYASAIAQGPDGRLYHATVETPTAMTPGDSKIYRSDDDGETWPASSAPGQLNDWWQSLEVAPSSAGRLYLSGHRFIPAPGGGTTKAFLLFRSDDAGVSWQPLPAGQLAMMAGSELEIAGISHSNPDLVFARVRAEDNGSADAIYRSADGGMTWTRILARSAAIAFVVRRSGELVAATQTQGAMRSTDNGATWIALASPPHINCLTENSAGEVWACTQNYGGAQAPSDGFGIMRSVDLITWTGGLKYQQIKAPVACAPGTAQRDRCDAEQWGVLCAQLGCGLEPPVVDGPVDAPAGPGPDPSPAAGGAGCCKVGATPAPGALLLVILVGALVLRARRHRLR